MPRPRSAPVTTQTGTTGQQPPNFDEFVAATTAAELLPPEAVVGAVPVVGVLTTAQVAKTLGVMLAAFATFHVRRQRELRVYLTETIPRLHPDRTAAEIRPFVRDELARDRAFVRNQRERLKRDLTAALRLDTMQKRRLRIRAVLDRERRYTQMREQAALQRAAARASFLNVREDSPEGAYWMLGLAQTHTPDCVAMSGSFWPWEVLDHIHPLLHHGCQCHLLTKDEAVERGLMHPDQMPDTADALRRAAQIARTYHLIQEVATPEEIATYLGALVEAQARYAKGTHEGGKFKPRGGIGHPVLARSFVERALRKLVPRIPTSLAERRRDRVGEWRTIAGQQVWVPEHRAFEREIGGRMWYSPPGSTEVYEQKDFVRRPPEMPREQGADLSDTAMRQRQQWRLDARAVAERALDTGSPPAEVGAHPKAVHGGMLDAGFRLSRGGGLATDVDPLTGAVTNHYTHLPSGARASLTYHEHEVTNVEWQPGRTQDVRPLLDRPPTSVEEFLDDVFSIANALAAPYGRRAHVLRVAINDKLGDTSGLAHWDGLIELGPDVRLAIEALVRARGEGRSLDYAESRGVYKAYRTAVHEALHAAAPISPRLYSTRASGRGIEEALTEELSALHVVDVLKRQRLDEVLRWLKANPSDERVEGNYAHYRIALTKILDRAELAPEKRSDALHTLKFSFEPDQRPSGLAALISHAGSGYHQNHEQAVAWVNEQFATAGKEDFDAIIFAPNVRPDLSDVADTAAAEIGGAEVVPGSWVKTRAGRFAQVMQVYRRDDGPLFDLRYGPGQTPTMPPEIETAYAHGVHPDEISEVTAKPQGSFPGVGEVTLGGETYRPGDRVSYSNGAGGRTLATIERIIRVQNWDLLEPALGWQIEALTSDGVPILMADGRVPGLRRADGIAEGAVPDLIARVQEGGQDGLLAYRTLLADYGYTETGKRAAGQTTVLRKDGADPIVVHWGADGPDDVLGIAEAYEEHLHPRDRQGRWSPATHAMLGLMKSSMTMRAHAFSNKPQPHYYGFEDYVLRHGKLFHHGPHESSIEHEFHSTTARQCFGNALEAALVHPDLTYVEGYAFNGILPVHHAWLVDEHGTVHDPTWGNIPGRDGTDNVYIGIPFQTGYVSKIVHRKGTLGLLDWMGEGVPLDEPPPPEAIADVPGETIPEAMQGPDKVLLDQLSAHVREAYEEHLHPRGRSGQWIHKSYVARGFADAAKVLAEAYGSKAHRHVARDEPRAREFLAKPLGNAQAGENQMDLGPINLYKWEHDQGGHKVLVSTNVLDGAEGRGKSFGSDEHDAVIEHAKHLASRISETRHEVTRKSLRGIVEPDKGNGKRAYDVVEKAAAENEREPRFDALRERWPEVDDHILLIAEKGYGNPHGLADVMVNASRTADIHVTRVNALAVKVWEDMFEKGVTVDSRERHLNPGVDHVTMNSLPSILRHEWGHSLWEEMSQEQRDGFRAQLPQKDDGVDWDEVGKGLSKYAAGDEESRADYKRRTSVTDGYLTETFAEAVALTTASDYKPGDWPDWVRGVSDYIEELKQP